jgi:hypothetical protein
MAPHQPKIPITDVGSHFNPQSYIRNPEAAFRNNSVPNFSQCVLVLSKVRRRLTTFNFRRPKFDLHDGNPVRKLRPGDGKELCGRYNPESMVRGWLGPRIGQRRREKKIDEQVRYGVWI